MKTILVDAWNTFITENGIFEEMKELLDSYENQKIILTKANNEEKIKLGIIDMPYKIFSLSHNPNKTEPLYYKRFMSEFNLTTKDIIYFEHNEDAVKSAKSVWINTFHYNKEKKNLEELKNFIDKNI